MNVKSKKKKNQVVTVNIFEQQEMIAKAEGIVLWSAANILERYDSPEYSGVISFYKDIFENVAV